MSTKFTSALSTDIVRINILYEPTQTNHYLTQFRWLTVQRWFDLSPFAFKHLLSRNTNFLLCSIESNSITVPRQQEIKLAFVRAFLQSELHVRHQLSHHVYARCFTICNKSIQSRLYLTCNSHYVFLCLIAQIDCTYRIIPCQHHNTQM